MNHSSKSAEEIKTPAKPVPLKVLPDNIPDELKALDAWLSWAYELREDQKGEKKWTKPPYNARTKKYGSTNREDSWSTFAAAVSAYTDDYGLLMDGIGIRVTSGYAAVDLDHCFDPETKVVEDWAQSIITLLDSYTELSPSGTGLRIFVKADSPKGRKKKGNVELYDQKSPRFVTMTGHHLEGTPHTIEARQEQINAFHAEHLADTGEDKEETLEAAPDRPRAVRKKIEGTYRPSDTEVIEKALDAKNGELFGLLLAGDWEGAGYDSQSSADLAFVSMTAFFAGPDVDLIDEIVRGSGLYRLKWDSKRAGETYGERTIIRGMYLDDYYVWSHPTLDDVIDETCRPWDGEDDSPDDQPFTYEDIRGQDEDDHEGRAKKNKKEMSEEQSQEYAILKADLEKNDITVLATHNDKDAVKLTVKCGCCNLPGKFVIKSYETFYTCPGSGKVTWSAGKRHFRLQSEEVVGLGCADILAMPKTKWLVHNHVKQKKFALIYGEYATAKSFYGLEMALCVAKGIPFLGQYEVTKGKVVYVYSEGLSELQNRLNAWMKHKGEGLPPASDLIFFGTSFKLDKESSLDRIIELIDRDFKDAPDLIIIDTVARNMVGDENSGTDMGAFVSNLSVLSSKYECTTLGIHHAGKDLGKKNRGHTSLPGAADTIIEITHANIDKETGDSKSAKIRLDKLKDGKKSMKYILDKVEIQYGESEEDSSLVLVPSNQPVAEEVSKEDSKHISDIYDLDRVFNDVMPNEETFSKSSLTKMMEARCDQIESINGIGSGKAYNMPRSKVARLLDKLIAYNLCECANPECKNPNNYTFRKTRQGRVDFGIEFGKRD